MKQIAVVLLLILTGCATPKTVLVNSKGEERYCEATGYGFVGVMLANNRHTDCVNTAGKDGFKPKDK